MRFALLALVAMVLVPAAPGQMVGKCTLNEEAGTLGTCELCPPGGLGYGNCTLKEVTYDSWCGGACLLGRTCVPNSTQNLPVYILYECFSSCDHPTSPFCDENPVPVQILFADVAAGCECTLPDT